MPEFLLPFTLFAIAGSFTPGPNNIMLTASGANFGFRRTLPHILGICVGFPLMVTAVGLGLGRLFEEVPVTHSVLKLAGSAYLLWLAWRIAQAGSVDQPDARARPLSFFQAAAFQWVNPKAWIMAMGAISTFTLAGQEMLPQVLTIAAIFTVVSVPSATVWTLLGIGVARILTSPAALRLFNLSMGALLALSVVWILFE
ncbi:MAG: lysine transporter LysE [Rhodospirillales bacterium]|jgi:threonine/homoserine/homoserine lactone efflux protein|nr:lysine transporter LysE [Rhodospirillales bacterium]